MEKTNMAADVKDKPVVKKRIKEFAENTSCHGVQRITNSKDVNSLHRSRARCLVWLALTLASFGMAYYNLFQIIKDYRSYPTTTLMERKANTEIEFPAVTICNVNYALNEKMMVNKEFRELWKQMRIEDSSDASMKAPRDAEAQLSRIQSIVSLYPTEERFATGHQLEEMLIKCQFVQSQCDVEDFYSSYSVRRGMCYTFNLGFDQNNTKIDIKKLGQTGDENRLRLILDVQTDKYLWLTENAGIHVYLHKARTGADLDRVPVTLPPGFHTSLGLSLTESIEAEEPHGNCVPAGSIDPKRNMYASMGMSYTKHMCIRSCQQANIIHKCGCCGASFACNPGGLKEMFGFSLFTSDDSEVVSAVCNSSDLSDVKCLTRTYNGVSKKGTCEKQCPPECRTVSYQIERGMSVWPNQKIASRMYGSIGGASRSGLSENASSSPQEDLFFVRENVVKLDVYFMTGDSLVITTQPAYTWNTLLCNIGGQLGLWLGFSILTAVEFIELLWDIVIGIVFKLLRI